MNSIPLHVLYVEDSDIDAELVEAQLGLQEFNPHVVRVETAEEMTAALNRQEWDVILADYSLPSFSAAAALEIMKQRKLDYPFIVISGTVGASRAIEMMKAGAQDFIAKGDFIRLIPAIRREIAEAKSRRARREAESALALKIVESNANALRAEEASRAKTDFLANMSHEIRTPLGAILGFAELMADTEQTEQERRDCIEVIRRNGKQLSRLIDEILDLTKIEAQRLELERQEFSISALVEDVTTLLNLQAQAKNIPLKVTYAEKYTDVIVSDPTRVRQVLINLVGNAIKFTMSGQIELKVSSRETQSGRVACEFAVTDTGIGLSKEQANKLFQPFVQADSSMTRKFGGTGLGLALSRQLAQALGGDLVLSKSELNKGSTFVFTIDAEPAARAAKLNEANAAEALVASRAQALAGRRILVVDDAPDNRVLVARYLTRVGAEVETASDGAEGAQRALESDYDVVLMDLQMPRVDGFEAMKTLKEKNYSVPVIALTAHAMRGDRERCLEAGFSEHVSKPIDAQNLIRIIQNFESAKPVATAAP
jgi:two-component system, sensor histidine kinase